MPYTSQTILCSSPIPPIPQLQRLVSMPELPTFVPNAGRGQPGKIALSDSMWTTRMEILKTIDGRIWRSSAPIVTARLPLMQGEMSRIGAINTLQDQEWQGMQESNLRLRLQRPR